MNFFAGAYFAVSIFATIVAFLILSRKTKSAANIYFALFCLAASVWLFCSGNMYISENTENAMMWGKIGFASIVFIPVFLLKFTFAFTKKIAKPKFFYISYAFSVFAALLNFISPLFYSGVAEHSFGLYPDAGFLYIFVPLQYVFFIFLSYKNLKAYIKRPDLTAYKHKQIRNILNSLWILSFILLDHILVFASLPLYPLGAFCIAAFVTTTVITLGRYSFDDIKIIVSRAFVMMCIVAVILSSSYFVWKHTHSWFVSSILTFLLAVMGTYIYRAAVDKADDLFLAEQKHYHNTLAQAASGMAREHNLKKLLKLISIIVMRSIHVRNIAIFLEDSSGKVLKCEHIRPHVPKEQLVSYTNMHPFIVFMKNKRKPFVAADLPLYIINSVDLPFRPGFVVPFFYDNGTNGFIIFSSRKDEKPFNRDDIRTFETLSRQTSLAIENCLFFEEFKHTQEKIFTAEKLASVGGLAEGVAHQINNRLNQFSMIAGELKYEIDDFIKVNENLVNTNEPLKKMSDYITSLSDSLTQNIKRTDAVIKGILNYSRAEKQGALFSDFSLREAFDLALELLKLKHKLHKDFRIDFNFQNDNDKIYGIRSQITEAVYNIIDNAYEATKEKYEDLPEAEKQSFKPLIKVNLKNTDIKNIISIEDNGCGIKDENLSKIFAPFFTTKSSYKSGTGIGMYIVKRMIEENHKGKVSFESEYGTGTKIIFELPTEIK